MNNYMLLIAIPMLLTLLVGLVFFNAAILALVLAYYGLKVSTVLLYSLATVASGVEVVSALT